MKTAALTILALVAFAANSLLCRGALAPGTIDAASFTLTRIAAGALTLAVLVRAREDRGSPSPRGPALPARRELASPVALFAYAIAFSLAYLRLSTGTGALILFGVVQVTMISAGIRGGERPPLAAWLGSLLAVLGLVALLLPGVTSPDPAGALLMAVAGVAWGVYTLRGRGASDPLAVTARNFSSSVPLAIGAFVVALAVGVRAEPRGLALAALSGSIASGLGYAAWYTALRGLTATRAAVLQLSVPVLAATGGVLFLGEAVTARLVVCACAILGGIALVVLRR